MAEYSIVPPIPDIINKELYKKYIDILLDPKASKQVADNLIQLVEDEAKNAFIDDIGRNLPEGKVSIQIKPMECTVRVGPMFSIAELICNATYYIKENNCTYIHTYTYRFGIGDLPIVEARKILVPYDKKDFIIILQYLNYILDTQIMVHYGDTLMTPNTVTRLGGFPREEYIEYHKTILTEEDLQKFKTELEIWCKHKGCTIEKIELLKK